MDLFDFIHEIYVLPPYCSFVSLEELGAVNIPKEEEEKIKKGNLFLVFNAAEKRLLHVNPTIKQFLSAFEEPKTLKNVVKYFALILEKEPDAIVEEMANFMLDMLNVGLIMKENDLELWTGLMEPSLEIGSVFNSYLVQEVIQVNRSAEIYLAKSQESENTVIIKKLKYGPYDHKEPKIILEKKQKFIQEFSIQQKLSNFDSVCKVLELSEYETIPYAILEYIEGKSLKDFIDQNPDFPLPARIELINQLLKIAACLHENEILHGDLHNRNFLITPELEVKVIDFGFANHAIPQKGEFIHEGGPVHFLPPERISKDAFFFVKKEADFTSEVFQYGILIFFILYGEMPFNGFTWKELSEEIEHKAPVFDQMVHQELLPQYVLKALKKALEKNPKERFIRAVEFNEEWERNQVSLTI